MFTFIIIYLSINNLCHSCLHETHMNKQRRENLFHDEYNDTPTFSIHHSSYLLLDGIRSGVLTCLWKRESMRVASFQNVRIKEDYTLSYIPSYIINYPSMFFISILLFPTPWSVSFRWIISLFSAINIIFMSSILFYSLFFEMVSHHTYLLIYAFTSHLWTV